MKTEYGSIPQVYSKNFDLSIHEKYPPGILKLVPDPMFQMCTETRYKLAVSGSHNMTLYEFSCTVGLRMKLNSEIRNFEC